MGPSLLLSFRSLQGCRLWLSHGVGTSGANWFEIKISLWNFSTRCGLLDVYKVVCACVCVCIHAHIEMSSKPFEVLCPQQGPHA